ncbi:carboxypeptidase family protein [Luteibacter rhizovicinus]|uniref:Carboxypeptidase family protein n=1 Tax=Luteibacter rhizovicinus TaxID=242606 RepID=A0A4R3YQA7_9GAMM|nr:TonB-dependent receptor [Luteibacter rhizovicinus]TCV94977.1 carboxypeptidase family protein [Luteibacter rhizovicinus]
MTSTTLLTRSRVLKRTALVSALGACLVAGSAFAQSTVGDVYGTATASQTIQMQNLGSGQTRQVTVGEDGRYRVSSLPVGNYRINVQQNGQTVTTRDINVIAGQSAQINFTAPAASADASPQSLDTVTVSANALASIDVASVESRTSFTADQLDKLPVPRNVVDVAALTPGTTKGDTRFGNLPSFGGSSVAENSYYVNGFNVTNLYNNLSFSEVPFQAIQQLDVQTGGYGAQYGFSTGGVTSVITKRGTNEWKGGASWVYTPAYARENEDTTYRKNGTLYRNYDRNSDNDNVYSAWIGGALVKDKLFFYGIFQSHRETGTTYPTAPGTGKGQSSTAATRDTYSDPFYLIKLDWNINDSNILEYTRMNNTKHTTNNYYSSVYGADGTPYTTDYRGQRQVKTGGDVDIFKYTSYLTDDLTLSAQWGKMKSKNSSQYIAPDGTTTKYDGNINGANNGCPYVIDSRDSTINGITQPYNSCYTSSTIDIFNGEDKRTAWRIDLDWKIGDHDIAGGFSKEKWSSDAGQSYAGGSLYYYQTNKAGQDFVSQYNYRTGGSVSIDQKSYYLQDSWQINDRFLAYIGVRNDSFDNMNGAGKTFVKQNNIWQPRLGLSWDLFGDSSTKIFATAGRYSLPIAANVALRAATSSYYTIQDYNYSGVNAQGVPTLGAPIGDLQIVNGENGSTPDPRSVASRDLKPYSQDEYILGFQHRLTSDNEFLNDWVVGAKAIYRKLNNAIDDTCDWRPFYAYGQSIGLNMDANGDKFTPPSTMPGCYIYNPGSKLTLDLDLDGSGVLRNVTIPGDKLGPKAKRSYQSVVLTAEKATDKWYVNASYTWAKNYGNTEGLVKSDNAQTDTGTTSAFDYPEIMNGSNGYLPNDRRHSIKAYGGYKFTPEWSVGLNLLVESGRPTSCFGGGNGIPYGIPSYQSEYFYCEGEVNERGHQKRLPWNWTISPNVVYTPAYVKGLTLQLDAINVFNNSKPIAISEIGERANQTFYNTTYRVPTYYQTPRYFRLMVQYDFTL